MFNSTNSFDVTLTPALVSFRQTLELAQSQALPEEALTDLRDRQVARLNGIWNVLMQLALQGNQQQQLLVSLGALLAEWAVKRAYDVLLEGQPLDPADSALQDWFAADVEREHQLLSTELAATLEQGRQERELVETRRQAGQNSDLQQLLHGEIQQQQRWQQAAYQAAEQQQRGFQSAQQIAASWANVALDGVKQAQEGARDYQGFARDIHGQVLGFMGTVRQEQHTIADDAAWNAARNIQAVRRRGRLIIFGVLLVVIPLLLWLCYLILINLY